MGVPCIPLAVVGSGATGALLLCMVAPGSWDVLGFELCFGDQVVNVRFGVSPEVGFGDQVVNVKLGVSPPLPVQDTWG